MMSDVTISPEVRAKAREAVRKAWVSPWPHDDHRSFDDVIIARADQFINAILAEVVGPERVIVPREATAKMIDAGDRQDHENVYQGDVEYNPQPGDYEDTARIWSAMISASQEGSDGDSLARSLKETGW